MSPDWDATTGDAEILNKPTVQYTEAIADATTSVAGLMSGTDKTKLDGVAVGAEVNVLSDWDATTGDAVISNKPTIQYTSAIADATTSVAGLMSSTDKTKLDGVAVGAEVNVLADWNATTGDAVISNKPTVQYTSAIADATTSVAGLMSGTDKTKLDGVAVGAEVNVQADWDAATGDAAISNKPTLGDSAAKDVGVASGDVAAGDHTHSGYASSTHPHDVMSSANSYAVGFVPSGSATHGETYLRKDGTWETPASTVDWAAASAGTIHATNYTNTTYTSGDFDHDNLAGVNTVLHADWTTDQHGYFGYIHPDNIEFINASAGAGDAGKPVVLDAEGQIDTSMINSGDVSFVDLDDLPSTFTPSTHTHDLSDVSDSGAAAALDVGTASGEVAAGDHSHDVMASGSSYAAGFVPAGNINHMDKYLRKDGTWNTIPMGGLAGWKTFYLHWDDTSLSAPAGKVYYESAGTVVLTHDLGTAYVIVSMLDIDDNFGEGTNRYVEMNYGSVMTTEFYTTDSIRLHFASAFEPSAGDRFKVSVFGGPGETPPPLTE